MPEPKGGLLAMVGMPKPKDDDEDSMESAKMTAAEDIIAATEAKDPAMLADAYQRMYDACAGSGGYGDEE